MSGLLSGSGSNIYPVGKRTPRKENDEDDTLKGLKTTKRISYKHVLKRTHE